MQFDQIVVSISYQLSRFIEKKRLNTSFHIIVFL